MKDLDQLQLQVTETKGKQTGINKKKKVNLKNFWHAEIFKNALSFRHSSPQMELM